MVLGTLVALARTEMWSQPPYNQKAMSLRAYMFYQRLFHKPPRIDSVMEQSQVATALTPMP